MISKPKVLAIIPARGGSKGVPGKNIKLLNGKPLIEHTIETAKRSKLIDKLIVSSDDESILKVAKKPDVEIPFTRPSAIAQDSSTSLEVVQHALSFYENNNIFFDAVILLQPTSPFRPIGFIDLCIKKFIKFNADSLISVLPVPHQFNPHWVFEKKVNGSLKIATGENEIIKRRQDLPKAYFRDGSIYITKTDVLKQGSLYGTKIHYIESNPKYYVNIDTEWDWIKAEEISKKIYQ